MSAFNRFTIGGWLAATLLLLANAWPTFLSVVDDAYIAARYAEQLSRVNGLVYNAGQPPIEGVTDLLWCVVVAVCMWTGLPTVWLITGLGFLFGSLALGCAIGLTGAMADRRGHVWTVLPALILAMEPHLAVACTNGLESSMFLFGVLGAMWWVVDASGRFRWAAGLFTGLVALIRPEGLAVGLAVIAYDAFRRGPDFWRRFKSLNDLAILVPTVGTWVTITAVRLVVYQDWVPNTFAAKSSFPLSTTFSKNAPYLTPETDTFIAAGSLLALGLLLRGNTWTRWWGVAVGLGLAIPPLTVNLWMPGLRLFLPSMALVICFACAPSARWRTRNATVFALALLGLAITHYTWTQKRAYAYDGRHTVQPGNGAELAARHLAAHAPPGAWLATRDAGVLAYFVGIEVHVAELHERALTQRHVDGRAADYRTYTPINPEFFIATVRREKLTDFQYGPDRTVFGRTTEPYRYLGRVHQHYHRYYDVYVRADLGVPDLPEEIVVNHNGVKPRGAVR